MFASALIVFREVLEAALVIAIVMAATRTVPNRGKWISLGVAGGAAGAGLVAALTGILSSLFQGSGQEIVNASILLIAVALIGWHVVWMNSHGREMAEEMRAVGKSVSEGTKHMSILAVVIAIAVMREGSEVVLMLQGLWATGSTLGLIGGGGLGFAAGALVGALIYAGLLALPIQRVFAFTNVFLVLIAAGMAARGANFLNQADLIPSLGNHIWDTSMILSDQSILGQFMAALTGYIARPSGVEVLGYAVTVGVIAGLMFGSQYRQNLKTIAVGALAVIGVCCLAGPAHAVEVLSPYVVKGEAEFEQQGYISHDRDSESSHGQAQVFTFGYSPTSFWRSELEGEFEREAGPDQALRFSSVNTENTFQLAEAGEYWIDPGFFYEMDFARGEEPNDIVAGFLGAKTIGPIAETFNLLLHKDFGPSSTPVGFIYSNQAKYRLKSWFEPGFEIYGDTDGKAKFADQQLAIGPGIFGKIYTFNGQALKYETGYLFGATPASPDGALRWKLEYEFYF